MTLTSDLILPVNFNTASNVNILTAAPGAGGGVVQHERGHPQRGGRCRPHLEHKIQESCARVHLPVPGGFIMYKKAVPEYIFQYQVGLSSTRKVCQSTSSSTRWVYQIQESCARVHLPVPGGFIKYKKTVPEYIFQYQVGCTRSVASSR